jgi:hypothetical protein
LCAGDREQDKCDAKNSHQPAPAAPLWALAARLGHPNPPVYLSP